MSNLYGKKVKILKEKYNKKAELSIQEFSGDVTIVDKVMVCMSEYYKIPIMNNASFEAYVGLADELNENGQSIIVLFTTTDIKRIY